jgi:two-component system sensor histidine kinase CreC
MDQALRDGVAELAPRWQHRRLRWSGLDALPAVALRGEAEALALLLHNLLGNAIEFAPEGSVLELDLRRTGPQQAELTLRDHGRGVPPEQLARLGEPWFSTARPDGSKGSGLGLAIATQAAALLHGELAFDDAAPGLRVRFTFRSHSP